MFGNITQKQWDAHASFREDLKKMLFSDVFQKALAIVKDKGLKLTPITGVEPIAIAALMGSRKDGYFEGLDNLFALLDPAPPAPKEMAAWTTPPPAKPAAQPAKAS
jgi:hypothetical protein